MQKIQRHLVDFGSKVHGKLHDPVHDVLSWLAIAAVSASSFLIMTTVLAQTEMINEPFNDPSFSTSTPMQPMPFNGAPCVPGTPCPALENSFNGTQPMPFPSQPMGSSTPYVGNSQSYMFGNNMQQPGMPQDQMMFGKPMSSQEGFMQKPFGTENMNQGFGGYNGMENGQMNQGFGQPMGNNMGFNQGPSEEDMVKMDEQRFKMMKSGLSRFTSEINRVKTQINSYKKKGMTVPSDLKEAVEQTTEFSKKVKEAKNADELDELMSEFQDSMDVIQEWMPKLPRLAEYPRFIKQAEKEIAKANKAYKSDAAKIKKAKLDLEEPLSEFKQAIEKQEELLKEVKELAKTDPDEALDRLHEEFFGAMDDMWSGEQVVSMSLNIKKGLTQMNRDIKDAEMTIKKLKRQKIDTKDLENLLAQSKEQAAELKKIAAAKPIDTDAMIDAVDALMEVGSAFENKVQELTGDTEYMPDLPKNKNFKFNLPKGYNDLIGTNTTGNASSQTATSTTAISTDIASSSPVSVPVSVDTSTTTATSTVTQ